jgi:hypothetical protein
MIIGGGLAGLITAHIFQREMIYEAAESPLQMHKALLRFRTDAVSRVTGIEFREVMVRKGIWFGNHFVDPSIAMANLYAQKCLGRLVGERSIWHLDPVKRYIAPPTFYEQLVEAMWQRINWSVQMDFNRAVEFQSEPFISTAPLPIVLKSLGVEAPCEFNREPITVQRFSIRDCDVHQTVYFPDPEHSLYRASITGDLLICEFADEPVGHWMKDVIMAFALDGNGVEPVDAIKQSFGKIAPIPDGIRKSLMHRLTVDHNIFSIGRFATWRNILLDDVVNDVAVVKKLLMASDYDRRMKAL